MDKANLELEKSEEPKSLHDIGSKQASDQLRHQIYTVPNDKVATSTTSKEKNRQVDDILHHTIPFSNQSAPWNTKEAERGYKELEESKSTKTNSSHVPEPGQKHLAGDKKLETRVDDVLKGTIPLTPEGKDWQVGTRRALQDISFHDIKFDQSKADKPSGKHHTPDKPPAYEAHKRESDKPKEPAAKTPQSQRASEPFRPQVGVSGEGAVRQNYSQNAAGEAHSRYTPTRGVSEHTGIASGRTASTPSRDIHHDTGRASDFSVRPTRDTNKDRTLASPLNGSQLEKPVRPKTDSNDHNTRLETKSQTQDTNMPDRRYSKTGIPDIYLDSGKKREAQEQSIIARPSQPIGRGGLDKISTGKDVPVIPLPQFTKATQVPEHTSPTKGNEPAALLVTPLQVTPSSLAGTPTTTPLIYARQIPTKMDEPPRSKLAMPDSPASTNMLRSGTADTRMLSKDITGPTNTGIAKDLAQDKTIHINRAGVQAPHEGAERAVWPARAAQDNHAVPISKNPTDVAGHTRQPGHTSDTSGTAQTPFKGITDTQGNILLPTKITSDVIAPARQPVISTSNTIGLTGCPSKTTTEVPGKVKACNTEPGNRELTGAEIILATVIAAAGAARVRPDDATRLQIKRDDTGTDFSETDKPTADKTMRVPPGLLPGLHIVGDAIALTSADASDKLAGEKKKLIESDKVADVDSQTTPQAILHRPTCLVSDNDTLVAIAEELFHDANLAWLIADLNQQSIKETWEGNKRVIELRTRQQLELPVWQDIVEFYQSRPANSSPESLVTVVTNTRLDQELIDSTLGAVIGCAIPQSLLHKPT